jgi:hypothetical protein
MPALVVILISVSAFGQGRKTPTKESIREDSERMFEKTTVERSIVRNVTNEFEVLSYEATVTFNGYVWRLSVHNSPVDKEAGTDAIQRLKDQSRQFRLTLKSTSFNDPEFSESASVYTKFMKWNAIAMTNKPVAFSKPIGNVGNFNVVEFQWDGEKAKTNDGLEPIEVQLFLDLLKGPDALRADWKKKKAEVSAASDLFK